MGENLQRLTDGRDWYGVLTLENLDAVADRIRSMIGDGQPYSWTDVNEGLGWRPYLRTSQVAEKIDVTRSDLDDGRTLGHITVCDTYGVWGIDTLFADQEAARGKKERDLTFVSFERRGQLRITHYAPAGWLMYWLIAPEDRMPRHGDAVDRWLTAKRDIKGAGPGWVKVTNQLLNDYQRHADYLVPLSKATPVQDGQADD